MAVEDQEHVEQPVAGPYTGISLWKDIEPEKGSPDCNLRNAHTGIDVEVKTLDVALAKIDADPDKSEVGKAKARAEAVKVAGRRFAPDGDLTKIVDAYGKEMAGVESHVAGLGEGEITAQAEVRYGQLREWFSKQPKGGVGGQNSIIRDAVSSDPPNYELIKAIVTANDAMKIIDPKLRATLIAEMGATRFPKEHAKLEVMRKRYGAAKFGLERARELLAKHAPRPVSAAQETAVKPVWETGDADLRRRFIVGDGKAAE